MVYMQAAAANARSRLVTDDITLDSSNWFCSYDYFFKLIFFYFFVVGHTTKQIKHACSYDTQNLKDEGPQLKCQHSGLYQILWEGS